MWDELAGRYIMFYFDIPIGSLEACCFAHSIFSSAASIPTTSAPRRANGSLSSPAPHPTSNIRNPERGSIALLPSFTRPPFLK